jgi:hypothetical protein
MDQLLCSITRGDAFVEMTQHQVVSETNSDNISSIGGGGRKLERENAREIPAAELIHL